MAIFNSFLYVYQRVMGLESIYNLEKHHLAGEKAKCFKWENL